MYLSFFAVLTSAFAQSILTSPVQNLPARANTRAHGTSKPSYFSQRSLNLLGFRPCRLTLTLRASRLSSSPADSTRVYRSVCSLWGVRLARFVPRRSSCTLTSIHPSFFFVQCMLSSGLRQWELLYSLPRAGLLRRTQIALHVMWSALLVCPHCASELWLRRGSNVAKALVEGRLFAPST